MRSVSRSGQQARVLRRVPGCRPFRLWISWKAAAGACFQGVGPTKSLCAASTPGRVLPSEPNPGEVLCLHACCHDRHDLVEVYCAGADQILPACCNGLAGLADRDPPSSRHRPPGPAQRFGVPYVAGQDIHIEVCLVSCRPGLPAIAYTGPHPSAGRRVRVGRPAGIASVCLQGDSSPVREMPEDPIVMEQCGILFLRSLTHLIPVRERIGSV